MKYLSLLFVLTSLVGCAIGTPPNAFERGIYDISTQLVAVVTLQTNFVDQGTNSFYFVRPVTNYVENYTRTPKESVVTGIQAGGQIASTFGFGLGGIIASLVLGGVSAYAAWKNKQKDKFIEQKDKFITVLGQNIETASAIFKTQPEGAVLDSKFKREISAQQVEADVKAEAVVLAKEKVNSVKAEGAATRVNRGLATPNGK